MKTILAIPGTKRADALARIKAEGYEVYKSGERHHLRLRKPGKESTLYGEFHSDLTKHLVHIANSLETGMRAAEIPVFREDVFAGMKTEIKDQLALPEEAVVTVRKRTGLKPILQPSKAFRVSVLAPGKPKETVNGRTTKQVVKNLRNCGL